MGSLFEQIKADQLAARKDRNATIANLLGTVIGVCETRVKNLKPPRALSDAEVLQVVQRLLKSLNENLHLIAVDEARAEQLAKLATERDYLTKYLPQQLSDEEIAEIASHKNAIMNPQQIMQFLKTEHAGRFDPAHAMQIIRAVTTP